MTIRIVTDSTCDLPAAIISQYGICVVPIYVNMGSQSFLDGIDITRQEFYEKLPAYPARLTTAVPSLQKFRAMYDALAEEGASEVISIHISSTLSAIASVAQAAARETESVAVTVFDSRQLSLGTGFAVELAARLAQAGRPVTEILAALNELVKRIHVAAMLDTLEFLRRGGRMNSMMSTFGNLLQLKPLLKMYDGISSSERIRTYKHALKRLVEMLNQYSPLEKIAFVHTSALERVRELHQAVQALVPAGEVWIEQINPVLGAHIGPGVVGFACISKPGGA